jgi:hypothetical protein
MDNLEIQRLRKILEDLKYDPSVPKDQREEAERLFEELLESDEKIEEALEHLQERNEERKRVATSEPRQWPPRQCLAQSWKHKGLECAVVRGPISLCGYVKVPPGHPAHGKWYDDVDVDVHGGLTFCQLSEDGMWFGFDCGHHDDFVMDLGLPGRIWTVDDVSKEVESLAGQLAAMA